MNSPAAALAWEIWARHRRGLAAAGALVAGFAVWCAVRPLAPNTAGLCSMWFALALCYTVGVFAYGLDGRLEATESGFPARLFLLPVRTSVLVGWPMAQGVAAAVALWLVWQWLVLRPSGVETPGWWTAMVAAAVAASQALAWVPFGVPYLRLAAMIAVLTALVRAPAVLALLGDRFTGPDAEARVLVPFALGVIPVAFLMAWAGVRVARRGDAPDLLGPRRAARPGTVPLRERPPFASAMRAQMWYEWRVRGRPYVTTVACGVLSLAALGAAFEHKSGRAGWAVMMLLGPILAAPMWSFYGGTASGAGRLTAFAATRPLGNVDLVGAKVRLAGVATLAAWAVTFGVTAVWLAFADSYAHLGRVWGRAAEMFGTPRAVVGGVLVAVGSVLMTWRILVSGLWAGLTGRGWVAATQAAVGVLLGLQFLYEWVMWDVDAQRRERILALLPWAAGVAVGAKFLVAGWAMRTLVRRGEVRPGTAGRLVAGWCLAAAGLFGLLSWLVPAGVAPAYGLALGVTLALPLARLAVSPVALGWNRHG
jgi:hypothetical protein